MKRILGFLAAVCVFGLLAMPVHAFEMRQGNDITVAKDTLIKGTLVAGGSTVAIDGTVDGDLYCAAQTVIIRGTVTGDVLCVAQSITISGSVGESVRVMSQLVDISGGVKRNVVAAGQTVNVQAEGTIAGELMAAGQTVTLNSVVGGDVNVAVQNVSLGDKARIAGNFTYTSPNAVDEATGAAVTGKVSHIISEKLEPKPLTARKLLPKRMPWPANAVGPIIFYLIVGVLVVLVAKDHTKRVTTQMLARPWFDGFVGFLTFVAAPIAIMMVFITIIGIPVAIILGIIFALLLVVSRVYVAVIFGDGLMSAFGKKKRGLVLQVVIGVVIIQLLSHIPILGFLISSIATLWGLGGIVMTFGKRKAVK